MTEESKVQKFFFSFESEKTTRKNAFIGKITTKRKRRKFDEGVRFISTDEERHLFQNNPVSVPVENV